MASLSGKALCGEIFPEKSKNFFSACGQGDLGWVYRTTG